MGWARRIKLCAIIQQITHHWTRSTSWRLQKAKWSTGAVASHPSSWSKSCVIARGAWKWGGTGKLPYVIRSSVVQVRSIVKSRAQPSTRAPLVVSSPDPTYESGVWGRDYSLGNAYIYVPVLHLVSCPDQSPPSLRPGGWGLHLAGRAGHGTIASCKFMTSECTFMASENRSDNNSPMITVLNFFLRRGRLQRSSLHFR